MIVLERADGENRYARALSSRAWIHWSLTSLRNKIQLLPLQQLGTHVPPSVRMSMFMFLELRAVTSAGLRSNRSNPLGFGDILAEAIGNS